MVDMTPPPMKRWKVAVNSPDLSVDRECEVEARVEVEAQVRAAETALTIQPEELLKPKFRRMKREDQVAAVAKYAVATEQ